MAHASVLVVACKVQVGRMSSSMRRGYTSSIWLHLALQGLAGTMHM
jgi:hypothetical protein